MVAATRCAVHYGQRRSDSQNERESAQSTGMFVRVTCAHISRACGHAQMKYNTFMRSRDWE